MNWMGLTKRKEAPTKPLTEKDVNAILTSLFAHIRDNWEFYKNHLPYLRKTMIFYETFRCVVCGLPENKDNLTFFKDPIIYDFPKVFGNQYTEEIGNLVYDAWLLCGVPHMDKSPYEDLRFRKAVCPCGTPDKAFQGFNRVKEFPAQKEFLDALRNHPRIGAAMVNFIEDFQKQRRRHLRREKWLKLHEVRSRESREIIKKLLEEYGDTKRL